jgi:hypothetical protein
MPIDNIHKHLRSYNVNIARNFVQPYEEICYTNSPIVVERNVSLILSDATRLAGTSSSWYSVSKGMVNFMMKLEEEDTMKRRK